MTMYFERGKCLMEFTNHPIAFDWLLHIGDKEVFWIRHGKLARQFVITIMGRDMVNFRY